MRTIKNFWLLAAVLFLGCNTALWGQNAKAYIPVEQLPDLIQCLPPPPAKDSPAFQYDKQRYKWGKQQRKNAERAAIAKRDAVWTDEALMGPGNAGHLERGGARIPHREPDAGGAQGPLSSHPSVCLL